MSVLWAIVYADPGHRIETFSGEGAEGAARATWEKRSPSWQCWLMRSDASTPFPGGCERSALRVTPNMIDNLARAAEAADEQGVSVKIESGGVRKIVAALRAVVEEREAWLRAMPVVIEMAREWNEISDEGDVEWTYDARRCVVEGLEAVADEDDSLDAARIADVGGRLAPKPTPATTPTAGAKGEQ